MNSKWSYGTQCDSSWFYYEKPAHVMKSHSKALFEIWGFTNQKTNEIKPGQFKNRLIVMREYNGKILNSTEEFNGSFWTSGTMLLHPVFRFSAMDTNCDSQKDIFEDRTFHGFLLPKYCKVNCLTF